MTAADLAADPRFGLLADTVSSAQSLEDLVRPMLELLEDVTGLESTYLTAIDEDQGVQNILFARNTKAMQIPEGLAVPWQDTLCRRALVEERPYTDDVAGVWGDSDAARGLGIRTYLSTPVRLADGSVFGTLCAASAASMPRADGADRMLKMFSRMIAQQIERERLLAHLHAANRALASRALTDPLTELPNRRALVEELQRRLAHRSHADSALLVAFIDLDGFKAINDSHGHEAGDQFLTAIGRLVRGALRADDFAARLGGDEFVVLGTAPPELAVEAVSALRERLATATHATIELDAATIDYPGASVGVVAAAPEDHDADALLARADAAMYAAKHGRRVARRA